MRRIVGDPCDGPPLQEAVEQANILTDNLPRAVYGDKRYRVVDVAGVAIWRSSQKRRVTPAIKTAVHRRSASEPVIDHMKNDGLRRNWLKVSLGDARHAVLCSTRHNFRMTFRALQLYIPFFFTKISAHNCRGEPKNKTLTHLFTV